MVKEYLRLTRAHTAPLETVPAILGALLATGGQVSIPVVLWGVYGLLYHLAGYGMNSLVDWEKGYDKNDPHKQHHPLNRGTLSPREARLLVGGLLLTGVVLGVGLAWSEPLALAFIALGAVTGVMYNVVGKVTQYKFIFISIAHTTVFIVPYLAMGGNIFDIGFRLAVLYVFLWVVFQISVSGEIKDILELDEENFLRDNLGVHIRKERFPPPGEPFDDTLTFSKSTYMYSWIIKLTTLILGAYIFMVLSGGPMTRFTPVSILWFTVWGVMMIATVTFTLFLLDDGLYKRTMRINMMARVELLTMFIFIAALYPVIGLEAVVTLIAGSVLWVLEFNRIEWGTWLAPDV